MKPQSKFVFRTTKKCHKDIKRAAKNADMSMNKFIQRAVNEKLYSSSEAELNQKHRDKITSDLKIIKDRLENKYLI